MRFAINMPNFGDFGYPHRLAELAQEAEEAGWDGFFVCHEISTTTILPRASARVTMVGAPRWRSDPVKDASRRVLPRAIAVVRADAEDDRVVEN